MDGKLTQLPGATPQHQEGNMPWETLYKFAATAVSASEVAHGLIIMRGQKIISKSFVVE